MYKQLKFSFIIIIFITILISGCTKANPAEEIYNHLEKAVSLEIVFEDKQKPLSEAENEEYELYEKILSIADLEEIQLLATKAKEIANSRKEMITEEKDSIEKSYNEFVLTKPIIETIDDESLAKTAQQLVEAMENRYNTYKKLHEEYLTAITLDLELYELIQKDDLMIEQLELKHEEVNQQYEIVNGLKEEFNQYTIQYNDLKKSFYELAELEVVYK